MSRFDVTPVRSKEFEEIYSEFRGLARHKASEYFPPGGGDRDDLEQEALIGLWKAQRDYDESRNSSFGSFASLCISRNVITHLKTQTRGKHRPLNEGVSMDNPINGDHNEEDDSNGLHDFLPSTYRSTPEEILIYKEWLESLTDVFFGFSSLEQHAYELVCLQGFSYFEASNILDVSEKALDNALQRAKRKLKEKVGTPFDDD